jgi:hypothetical protein
VVSVSNLLQPTNQKSIGCPYFFSIAGKQDAGPTTFSAMRMSIPSKMDLELRMFPNCLLDLIHFVFSGPELTEKSAALVPPPQKNGVSYHGVLAPRRRFRKAVIPEPPAESDPKPRLTKAPKVGRSRWHPLR